MGRQAACSKVSSGGLATRFERGTATRWASAPWWRSESSERRGSSVSSPRHCGSLINGVDDHLVAILVDAGRVAAEDHRQLLLGQADGRAATTGRGGSATSPAR